MLGGLAEDAWAAAILGPGCSETLASSPWATKRVPVTSALAATIRIVILVQGNQITREDVPMVDSFRYLVPNSAAIVKMFMARAPKDPIPWAPL